MARVNQPLKHANLLLAGIAVFAVGMIGGFVRSADLVGETISEAVLVHAPGRVAGATTPFVPGQATLTIELPGGALTAVVDVVEPTSVFTLLRLAARRGSLTFDATVLKDGTPEIRSINGTAAPSGQRWVAAVADDDVPDLNAPVVQPGETVAIRLRS